MDVKSVPTSEDTTSFEKDDHEFSDQGGVKVTPRPCTAGLPLPTLPKPRQKNSSRPSVDSRLPDQASTSPVASMTVAKELRGNRRDSLVVTPDAAFVSRRNSAMEDASESDESDEVIPPARAIILALEQGNLKRESVVLPDRKTGPESRAVDSPLRRRIEPNLKSDNSRSPFIIRLLSDRKVPPRVPAKPFKVEGRRRVYQITAGSYGGGGGGGGQGQRNSFVRESEGSGPDCVSPNHGWLPREIRPDKLPELRQETAMSPRQGPECWAPLYACSQVQRSSVLFESSSSTSSLADAYPGILDIQQMDEMLRPVISFTTEDAEFSQKTQSCHLMSPTRSPVFEGQHNTRNRESGRASNSACRRSRSVGAPGFCHKRFSQPSAQQPTASAKVGGHVKHDDLDDPLSSSNSSTVVVPSPDHYRGDGTHALINQQDCLVFQWTSAVQQDRTFQSPQPSIKERRCDIKCKSTEAVDVAVGPETPNGKVVSTVETLHLELRSVPTETVVEMLVTGTGVQNFCQNYSVEILRNGQADSSIQNDSKRQNALEESIAGACKEEQQTVSPYSSQIGSFDLVGAEPGNGGFPEPNRSVSPVTKDTLTESVKCSQSFDCLKNSAEHPGKEFEDHSAKNGHRDGEDLQLSSEHLFSEEQFNLFNTTHSFADEIFQILPYDSSSLSSSVRPLHWETSGYGSVTSADSLLGEPLHRRRSDIVGMAETLSVAVDDIQEEMKEMWAESNRDTSDGGSDITRDVKPLLRNSSSRSGEVQKKFNNRKVSKAKSLKQWKRITHKVSRRLSAKPSERSDDEDFHPACSGGEDSDSGSEIDGNEANLAEDVLLLASKKDAERTRHQKMRSAFHVASELLVTERNYVKKLHLIDQVFQLETVVRNRDEQIFSGDVIPQMFSNIKSIYLFHHDFLLLQLEKRMMEWESDPRIGDVMRKFAPFLKLYTDYVKNFDNAISTINFWLDRSVKFKRVIQEIQRRPECGQLNLQHHMLEPIQRVPRYQLLLKDYLRLLPQDSADREDTIEALDLVTKAAWHSNEVMKKTEKFNKLLEINESLGGNTDLVCPTRELVKEGKIIKISARDGSQRERYLFLFSNLLLICQNLPLKIGQKQQYRIKSRMDFDGMEALVEGSNLETENTFYIKGRQRSFEFHASSVEEKNDWMKTFKTVIAEFQKNYKTEMVPDVELGKRAPIWVKDPETSMCMCCSMPFTPFRRRHHCRACGDVICGKCSSRRAPLVYNGNLEKRVCDPCFQKLSGDAQLRKDSTESVNTVSSSEEQFCRRGILQVKAREPAVLIGYMNMGCNKKSFIRRFFAVHEDFVMYSFKAHQDVVAMSSLPLPGYTVTRDDADEKGFKLQHKHEKAIHFQTEDETSRNRWVDTLQELVQLRLPKVSIDAARIST